MFSTGCFDSWGIGDDSRAYNLWKSYWSFHKHHVYEISSISERVAIYLRFLIQSAFQAKEVFE